MKFVDSHAHLTSSALAQTVQQVIKNAEAVGVHRIVNICTDQLSLEEGIKLKAAYSAVDNTAAVHPHDAQTSSFFPYVEKAAREKQILAIGETGLDYYYENSPKVLQKEMLIRSLHLALEAKIPAIFHCREAFDDLFAITDHEYLAAPAAVHCFSGNKQEAKKALDRGWMISFSGIITFKKSEELREIVAYTPLDRILIETDAPFLAPQSRRGKQNEPAFVVEVAETVARIKEIDLPSCARITSQNAQNFFNFSV